eukprot:570619-Prorocentrum_minimum.AAC.1
MKTTINLHLTYAYCSGGGQEGVRRGLGGGRKAGREHRDGWLPTFFIKELGVSTSMAGMLSAVPWIATAVVGYHAGELADWLLGTKGWPFAKCAAPPNMTPAPSLIGHIT